MYEGRPENDQGIVKYHQEGGRIVSLSWKFAYLRLERRGDEWRLHSSKDGEKWEDMAGPWGCEMPRKVKVGVVTEVTADGEFKVTFDKFKLTRPGK